MCQPECRFRRVPSLDTQEAACLRKAAEIGASVVKVLREEGVSGALLLARPKMLEALRLVEEGQANVMICADLSRFTRDLEHQQQMLRRIREAHGRLVLCTGEAGDTAEAEFSLDVQGANNKYNRRKIREATMKGRKEFAISGKQVFRRFSPWGYHLPTKAEVMRHLYTEDQLGRYLIVEEEAMTVRELFSRCAAGHSLRRLVGWLEETGVSTRTQALSDAGISVGSVASSWSRVAVRAILINPVYKGTAMFGRREAIFSEERTAQHPSGKRQYSMRTREDADCVPIDAPAIVSEEIWNAVQQRLSENKARLSGRSDRRFLLSGLLICPECGWRMTARASKGHTYYCCYNNRKVCTYRKAERAEHVEGVVTRAVAAMAEQPDLLQSALDTFHRRMHDAPGRSREEIERELGALEKRERATVQAQIAGIQAGADPSNYTREFEAISERRKALLEQMAFTAASERRSPLESPGAMDSPAGGRGERAHGPVCGHLDARREERGPRCDRSCGSCGSGELPSDPGRSARNKGIC